MKKTILTLCILMPISFKAAASDSSQEKFQLQLIKQRIAEIKMQINEARRLAEHNTSAVKFNYHAFESDLILIERGLEDYINNRQFAPRAVEPLIGDYRR